MDNKFFERGRGPKTLNDVSVKGKSRGREYRGIKSGAMMNDPTNHLFRRMVGAESIRVN